MGLIRWIFSLAVLSVWVALVGTALFVAMYDAPAEVPEAQAIIVLGGAGGGAEGLASDSARRIDRGIELYQAGKAPLLVMSGDGAPSSVAAAMEERARAAGVPQAAMLIEPNSHSTLQNALFTGDLAQLDKTKPVLIVTDRFHLPRAWASFRWAGFKDPVRVAADPEGGFVLDKPLLWESVKWPVNVIRAAAASAAMAGGVPRENYIQYLE